MKKHLSIFFLTILCHSLIGQQITEGDDGKYYQNNKPYTGIYQETWDNGNLKLEIPLRKGLKNGNVILYHENAGKSEVRAYKKGKMHGTWITWDEEGNKLAEANYSNGRKHGKWYVWDENGTKRYDMTYQKGDKTGIWYMWDEEGRLIMEKDHGNQ
jgi:antitoxin component YwqK of YwqJK toxin-antitoxin module